MGFWQHLQCQHELVCATIVCWGRESCPVYTHPTAGWHKKWRHYCSSGVQLFTESCTCSCSRRGMLDIRPHNPVSFVTNLSVFYLLLQGHSTYSYIFGGLQRQEDPSLQYKFMVIMQWCHWTMYTNIYILAYLNAWVLALSSLVKGIVYPADICGQRGRFSLGSNLSLPEPGWHDVLSIVNCCYRRICMIVKLDSFQSVKHLRYHIKAQVAWLLHFPLTPKICMINKCLQNYKTNFAWLLHTHLHAADARVGQEGTWW